MGVRNEVVQSVGKGQVHADSLSLAHSVTTLFPSVPLSAPHLQASEAIREKVVISAAAGDHF